MNDIFKFQEINNMNYIESFSNWCGINTVNNYQICKYIYESHNEPNVKNIYTFIYKVIDENYDLIFTFDVIYNTEFPFIRITYYNTGAQFLFNISSTIENMQFVLREDTNQFIIEYIDDNTELKKIVCEDQGIYWEPSVDIFQTIFYENKPEIFNNLS